MDTAGQKVFVVASSGDLAKEVKRPDVRDKREIEASLDGFPVKPERESRRRSAQICSGD